MTPSQARSPRSRPVQRVRIAARDGRNNGIVIGFVGNDLREAAMSEPENPQTRVIHRRLTEEIRAQRSVVCCARFIDQSR
jgi:hypothetical protein